MPDKGFLGPGFNYAQHIKSPQDLQLQVSGNLMTFAGNVASIGDYIAVLMNGPSRANKFKGADCSYACPLGDSFFLPTMAKCKNIVNDTSDNLVQRSVYINNIPTGNIPFLSYLTGEDSGSMRGLIPGIAQNLEVLNPITFFEELMAGPTPDCIPVTLPTRDVSGTIIDASGYLTIKDLSLMDPCAIGEISSDYTNWNKKDLLTPLNLPASTLPCGDDVSCNVMGIGICGECKCNTGLIGFQNMDNKKKYTDIFNEENLKEFYLILLAILGLYILLKLMHKAK